MDTLGRVAVVGAGAVGLYYGGLLALGGADVHFLIRSDFEAVKKGGLTIETGGNTLRLESVQAYKKTEEIGPCDLVLIALKTTSNSALEAILPPLLGPNTRLLTLQNGLGNEEYLAERWGKERVLGGLCYVCLNRTAPGHVLHLDRGSLSLGDFGRPPGSEVRAVAAALGAMGVDVRVVESLGEERWRKLLWNIPFNGLSIAAGGVTVADVLADESLRGLAWELMEEARSIAVQLGHPIPEEYSQYHLERSVAIGAYRTSSLIDWELGRPVEVESIWGEAVRQGAGLSVPRLKMLYALIKSVVSRPRRSYAET
jgi:2-dehydropantoate 2-reductase